jgi:hypothetical protein
MDAKSWPPLVQALSLPEVADLLGIPRHHLLDMVAQGLIAVCTRKPMAVGGWGFTRLGFGAAVVDVSERQPFDGRRLARLRRREAAVCVASGQVRVCAVHEEPLNHEAYVEGKREQWLAPGPGTVVATDDLLISRVEFEHFVNFFGHNLQLPEPPNAADAALGASRRQQLQAFASKPREDRDSREAEYQRWRSAAADIQQERTRTTPSTRALAALVKDRLGLPDSIETIRKRLKPG